MNANSLVLALALVAATTAPAEAASILFSQTLNPPTNNVSSATVQAEFSELSGTQFTLTLTYLAATVSDKFDNPAVLTGFSWDIATSATITAVSAVIAAGSNLIDVKPPIGSPTGDPNGAWAFKTGLTGGLGTHGVGTSGGGGLSSQSGPHLPNDSFGESDLISNLTGQTPDPAYEQVDGVDYGLVPVLAAGDSFNVNKDPVIQNSLVITLNVQSGTFNPLTDISNAHFLFSSGLEAFGAGDGTPTGDTGIVPEPSSLALLTIGLVGAAGGAARRRRRAASQNQDAES
ncbi:MAG: XDD4 family exosortase-dependent surface protein [Maioricimonas sp. JB049]